MHKKQIMYYNLPVLNKIEKVKQVKIEVLLAALYRGQVINQFHEHCIKTKPKQPFLPSHYCLLIANSCCKMYSRQKLLQ